MSESGYMGRLDASRVRLYRGIGELSTARKLMLAAAFAGLTAAAAQVRIVLPFTPVPFTLQVLPVLLSGALLGATMGFSSQMIYLALGAAGVPVFSNFGSGWQYLLGPTGGYILAFLPAALLSGQAIHAKESGQSPLGITLGIFAALGVIYFFGALQLALFLKIDAVRAFALGVLPFIGVDAFKAAVAVGISHAALPGRQKNPDTT